MLLSVGLLRFDARGIEDDITQARADGDCGAVTEAQEQVWAGHRVAAAPVAARGDAAVDTCERLETAEARLAAGLDGGRDDLTSGFLLSAPVLEEDSRNDATVGAPLTRFLTDCPPPTPARPRGSRTGGPPTRLGRHWWCGGQQGFGSAVRTCPYRSGTSVQIAHVTFRKVSLPVKVYALWTGKHVADRTAQTSGSTCSSLFSTSGVIPPDKYVTPSKSDIRNAFSSGLGR
ncbi:hypothetical protein WJ438_36785 [Streptomyces sp. GD-15H]|uniref:hypothetical protein n=1 Tax=Streptomyces sp. GD-15H TaxID=3129112 RepID=UPI00324A6671